MKKINYPPKKTKRIAKKRKYRFKLNEIYYILKLN